jgi:hypothetical protein
LINLSYKSCATYVIRRTSGRRGFTHKICEGASRRASQAIFAPPRLTSPKPKPRETRSKQQGEQTNIKQLNHIAQHQRHHPVVLEAQISTFAQ